MITVVQVFFIIIMAISALGFFGEQEAAKKPHLLAGAVIAALIIVSLEVLVK